MQNTIATIHKKQTEKYNNSYFKVLQKRLRAAWQKKE